MNQYEFGFKYCGPRLNDYGKWEFNHSSNENELKEKLQEKFMHVIPESALKHPERLRSMLLMTDDPRTPEFKAWEQKFLEASSLSLITTKGDGANQGELATMRKELGLSKVKWTAAYVRERLKTKGESIIVFAWHREVCENLVHALSEYKPALIIGGGNQEERERALNNFQAGKCRVLVMNILVGGRGFNLQRADRIVFCESSWTNETNLQAEKRASRKGRDVSLPVRCDYVVVPGSIDEMILKAVFRKDLTVKKVIGQ